MSKKRGSSSLNRPVKRILMETSARTSDEVMRKLIAADPSKQRLSKKVLRKGVCDTMDFLKKKIVMTVMLLSLLQNLVAVKTVRLHLVKLSLMMATAQGMEPTGLIQMVPVRLKCIVT